MTKTVLILTSSLHSVDSTSGQVTDLRTGSVLTGATNCDYRSADILRHPDGQLITAFSQPVGTSAFSNWIERVEAPDELRSTVAELGATVLAVTTNSIGTEAILVGPSMLYRQPLPSGAATSVALTGGPYTFNKIVMEDSGTSVLAIALGLEDLLRINLASGVVTTVASGFLNPTDLHTESTTALVIETGAGRLTSVDLLTSMTTTLANFSIDYTSLLTAGSVNYLGSTTEPMIDSSGAAVYDGPSGFRLTLRPDGFLAADDAGFVAFSTIGVPRTRLLLPTAADMTHYAGSNFETLVIFPGSSSLYRFRAK